MDAGYGKNKRHGCKRLSADMDGNATGREPSP